MRLHRLALVTGMTLGTLAGNPLLASDGSPAPPDPQFETFPVRPQAPQGAPNILVIMTDDVGFAASSTFGGPVPMPNYDVLASHGLRYNNFHTTAMCSPTRAALLTGRNHHRVGFGLISDVATDEPGYDAVLPESAATFGEVLKEHGYDTSWIGKNHNTPPWENTPLGPFDRWPNGLGFDYFYGFNVAWTNQFAPALVENRNTVRPHIGNPDYILDGDLADHAIRWLDMQNSLSPERPFLMYYAPGTAHSPQQAPKAWLEKFRGKFDMGWDKLREETFARQKAMGIIPSNAKLTPRPAQLPAWDSLTPEQKRVSSRMMEAFAAQLAFFDDQIGRVTAELKRLGEYDNTLIIYIQGDNGASEESGPKGSNNDFAGILDNEANWVQMAAAIDDIGGPYSWGNYQAGWAFAMNTPFQWAKEIASHYGGTTNGMVVSWPDRINGHGEVRPQFTHVIDVAPTIYQAVGITPPEEVDHIKQMPLDGISFAYTFDQPNAPSGHTEQYFELLGNRALYKDGWIVNTIPENMTWNHTPFQGDPYKFKWELYDLNDDYSQAVNVAEKYPDKLSELQVGFDAAAKANHVYPLYADFMGRFDPKLRPSILGDRTSVTYYPGDTRYPTETFPSFAGRAWTATAHIGVPAGSADGTLVAQGGWVMGWGLFVMQGRPVFIYRASDHDPEIRLIGPDALAPGNHVIVGQFTPDEGESRGGTVALTVDGTEVASQHITMSSPFRGLQAAVGRLGDEAISSDHQPPFAYQGKLDALTITLGAVKESQPPNKMSDR